MQYRPFARVGLYLFLVLIPSWVWAQGGDTLQRAKIPMGERETTSTQKTVEVSRAFAPTIQDADKVGRQPVMDDSASVAPHFTYELDPHPIVTHFALRPLPAARMGAETHDPTSLFYLKLGIGNYLSPLAEGYVTSKYHEHYSGGIAAKHRSAFGSVTLANGQGVDAPWAQTSVSLFGDAAFKDLALHGELWYRHALSSFYGASDTLRFPQNPYFLSRTTAHAYGGRFAFNSTYLDSSHFHYSGAVEAEHYTDSWDMGQHRVSVVGSGHMFHNHECYGGTLRVDYFGKTLEPTVEPNTIVTMQPWVKLFGDEWRVIVGVDLAFDYNNRIPQLHLFPRAHLSYDVIAHYLIPYAEAEGGVVPADYYTIRRENAWVTPGLHVWNTTQNLDIRLGLKGNANPRLSYNVCVGYSIVDSAHFFANRPVLYTRPDGTVEERLASDFMAIHDSYSQTRITGELYYNLTDRFLLGLRGDYWQYKLQHEEYPWHRPSYQATFHTAYNLRQKVHLGLAFRFENGAKAKGVGGAAVDLGPLYLLDLDARYQFSDFWSVFLDLGNVLACKHSVYYLYPMQRLHAHVGVILNF
ncbi:MAG: hypothetical protein AL399_05285 [Candidatus [Bacteroides] periocalifornicus]|uniref:TonB-dependent receptor-like beta-barrel domain-containing protein n=1 Tax=Candidatus [Bacteroides] periocalifornicus TaxID=1702214 RepID=A0A0Q4B867_9BACT|nr:MAG: hypothetical protein AL399_05285 [Candidatus [Bacteroides] periocalifornicus]